MSNSIWKTREETPKDFCDVVLANFETGSCCVFLSPFHNISFDYDKWCYLTDLIACEQELDRTRKALNFAISTLTVISEGCVIEHSVVGHEDDNKIKLAKIALEQITSLEQKD